METAIAFLYLIITVMFLTNLFSLFNQMRRGSKKVNKLSLIATSSLIAHSVALASFFMGAGCYVVFIAQLYLLSCMTYIRFTVKKKNAKKKK